MVIAAAGWLAATPFTLRHPRTVQRAGYALIGPAQRWFEHLDAKPGQYGEKDISPYFWHNGRYPESEEYAALQAGRFQDYGLRIGGLVSAPVELSLVELRAMPHHEQITGTRVCAMQYAAHTHTPTAGPCLRAKARPRSATLWASRSA